ncbi:TspO/MBR family protein [Kitasatospora sp. NPDC101801]|uniref:TspO/MBR family protein n=1 Tax=Kitasatospora sp. NPDC101801 TaxID=3364103 RepID=UPI003802A24B
MSSNRSIRAVVAAAVAATAAVGAAGVDTDSSWYRNLDKPAWQPPPPAFGITWTALYGLIAVAGGRALVRTTGPERTRLALLLGADLALNAGWNWLFFRARRPRLALAELVVLQGVNLALTDRVRRVDPVAGAALVPYAGWTGFAGALNTSLVIRNR